MQIIHRSFNAEPKELVPSKGVNDIQDNIIRTSFDLWSLINMIKEGSTSFSSILLSDQFNVDKSQQSSHVRFIYDSNNNIIRANLGNDRVAEFIYTNNNISKIILHAILEDTTITKTFIFNYDSNDNIISVNIE